MKIKSFTPADAINARAHRKENNFTESYSAFIIDKGQIVELVDLRLYNTSATAYACLWIRNGNHATGSGAAGQYGYHRPSEAAATAFLKAGVQFSEYWGGMGDSRIRSAVELTAKKIAGRRKVYVTHAHG